MIYLFFAMLPKPLVAASLRPIMLSLLNEQEMYGYQLIQQVQALSDGQLRWTANKLYPLLHRLEHKDLVEAVWRPSEVGPPRKYYRLTPQGQEALAAAKQEWHTVNRILDRLWGPDRNPVSDPS